MRKCQLDTYNRKWNQRYQILQEYRAPPWWSPGLILNNRIRYNYERFFPIGEYLDELRWLLVSSLPDPVWVPQVLKKKNFRSLPDFWNQLPQHLAGKVIWKKHELLPLACALASPPKNGCHTGRYPEQNAYLKVWLKDCREAPITMIDYGCGTGQVTYEIATLMDQYLQNGYAIGVAREPLEAWMASKRCLPHVANPQSIPMLEEHENTTFRKLAFSRSKWAHKWTYERLSFPKNPVNIRLYFVAADIRNFSFRADADLIVCNGLIGGMNLNSDKDFLNLWKRFKAQLKPRGILIVGSRFHGGFKQREKRFFEMGLPCAKLIFATCHTSVFTL